MALLDLSLVTQTLIALVKRRVKIGMRALQKPQPLIDSVSVVGLPADQLTGAATVGLYLYHITEESHFKNAPPISQDQPPIQFSPLALQLYYQLTTHSDFTESGTENAQLLFGLALKAMHDFPSIDGSTMIFNPDALVPAVEKVFPDGLDTADNVFRIVLQSIPPAEVTRFWTGTQAMRLAAYYNVSAVLLEPEPPSRYARRVLRYGVHTLVSGAPRLDASRATVVFRLPDESADRAVEVQPGEAPVGDLIDFMGTELAGESTTVLLRSSRFPTPIDVGATWALAATAERITAKIGAHTGSFDTLPGVYSAGAQVTVRRRLPDGSLRAYVKTSNEVPLVITPNIITPAAGPVAVALANVLTVTGGVFQHAEIPPEGVKVVVGAQEIPREPTATLTPGHYIVDSPTKLRFAFPIPGLASGDILPYRIVVNGAENAPRWVRVP